MGKNLAYLRGIVNRGDDVIFAGKFKPSSLDPNSVLAKEIEYLIHPKAVRSLKLS